MMQILKTLYTVADVLSNITAWALFAAAALTPREKLTPWLRRWTLATFILLVALMMLWSAIYVGSLGDG